MCSVRKWPDSTKLVVSEIIPGRKRQYRNRPQLLTLLNKKSDSTKLVAVLHPRCRVRPLNYPFSCPPSAGYIDRCFSPVESALMAGSLPFKELMKKHGAGFPGLSGFCPLRGEKMENQHWRAQ